MTIWTVKDFYGEMSAQKKNLRDVSDFSSENFLSAHDKNSNKVRDSPSLGLLKNALESTSGNKNIFEGENINFFMILHVIIP